MMTFLENDYREIITKAVCGKGHKFTNEKKTITPNYKPTSILGCWVINHLYNARKKSQEAIEVNGSYDVNIWYSYNDNTKTEVVTERIKYSDVISLTTKDSHCLDDDYDINVQVEQQPNCLECEISSDGLKVMTEVERELVVQVIGETKLYVKVDPIHQTVDAADLQGSLSGDELKSIDPDFLSKEKSK